MKFFKCKRDGPKYNKNITKGKEKRQSLQEFLKGDDYCDGHSEYVTELSALQTSAVYACVKVIAETVASLPLHLYRREQNEINNLATNHPLYSCLYETANRENTSLNFRESMMVALLLYGNAYARIVRDENSHVKEMWFLKPQNMQVNRDNVTKQIIYNYSDDLGKIYKFNSYEIFHLKGLSLDGIVGLSPIAQARQSVTLCKAAEEYGSRFFSNGARPGGVLEHPGVVKDPERLRESWNKAFQGAKNAHKIAVLEEGMHYHTIEISPEDAQFLETRKYQVNEICRIFRVPPHMIGDLDKATFSNIEQQSIEFVQYTIRPWLVRWEQEISRSLLSEGERLLYFAKFNVDGLLRGDYATRTQGYATGRQNGWLSINDIRKLEDMNPIPKEAGGDSYLVNGNMVSANANASDQT